MNNYVTNPKKDSSHLTETRVASDFNQANIHDLTDATCRLRKTVGQIESFLTGQLQRLTDAMRVYTQVRIEAEAVRERFTELELERQKWETQREAEVNRLQTASENLIAAWEQLDGQQRDLMLQQRRGESSRTSAQSNSPTSRSSSLSNPSVSGIPATVESTLLEIQMLKRDILGHSSRSR